MAKRDASGARTQDPPVTVAQRVRAKMEELAPSERRVARLLLTNYPAAGLQSINQLAREAGVSAPTVLRFLARIGFPGYAPFQDALREELRQRSVSPLALDDLPEAGTGARHAMAARLARAIEHSFALVTDFDFSAAIDLLADRRRPVLVTGGRFSDPLARYLWLHLREIRPRTFHLPADPLIRNPALVDHGPRSVAVVFDFRRYQETTADFAERAAERGVSIVLVTDPYLSPISRLAKVVLTVDVAAVTPFDSYTPAFALIEVLVAELVARLGDEARRRMAEADALRGVPRTPAGPSRG
ncbi:MAG: RpiR family transcriptional regulator [Rhodothalassiaceae bacterium]|nr:MAG: RpiR family transcriptional regulator [Rhodothalassiaceae bacterium]